MKNKKKILFIITKSEMGGTQRFLCELAAHLNPEKYEIAVAAGGHGELLEKLYEKNIETIKIRNFSNAPGIKNLAVFFEIFRLIKKTNPDILYLLSSEAGFIGSIAGGLYRFIARKKMKIIYRIGGWAFKEPRNLFIKKIYLWAEKISAPFKDIIITNSEFDRKIAAKNKIAIPEKILTVYNGIDLNELKFIPRETARKLLFRSINPISRPLIGTIANLYKNKGLEYLIAAAKKIKNEGRNWCFMIIGDGPEKNRLGKLIKNSELENTVFMVGAIPDAYQYLKAFDLFVLPSIKEGQPWAILEAMAAARPILATNIAGIPETIENEKSGLLVEPADSNALANAIEKIMTHPSLAQKCAKNAHLTVKEKFDLETMIGKNEKIFEND
ncbi:glycosyltransferase family 4 protein [Candidatus Azambacteria bacterium]|nr:glycosyltransferase family 4 protein [Candidatus Azambacteria bacterium]